MYVVLVFNQRFPLKIDQIVGTFTDEDDALKWVTTKLCDRNFRIMKVQDWSVE